MPWSKGNNGAVSLNLDHALAIKRTPCAFTFFASNGKVTAAHDIGLLQGVASALHFPRIKGVELQLTDRTIGLDEFHADDGAASVEDEALDDVGLGLGLEHGWNEQGGEGRAS